MAILRFYTTLVRHEYIIGYLIFYIYGQNPMALAFKRTLSTLSKRLHNYTILFRRIFQ